MSDALPADVLVKRQRAFLLHQLASVKKGELTQAAANKRLDADYPRGLGLTVVEADRIREELQTDGRMLVAKIKRAVKVGITDSGRELLKELNDFLPPKPKKQRKPRASKPVEYADVDLREAYILDIFSRAKNRTIPKADIERAFDTKGVKKKAFEAGYPDVVRFRGQGSFLLNPPATRHALDQLHEYVESVGTDGAEVYTLTNAGVERLKDLREEFPVLPPVGKPAKATGAAMREQWEAFVLLHLLNAPDHTVNAADVYGVKYPKRSKLNDATAWKLRGEMVAAKYVALEGTGKDATYTLTDAGKERLAGLSFDAFPEVKLKGAALTALLAAARGGEKEAAPMDAPPAAELEAAVMDIFHHLLRERHAVTGMVPIHEVRAAVRTRHGDGAASHETLDGIILSLWRSKRLRISSLEDAGAATHAQRQDSIPGVGETLFYLESAHDSAVV